MKAESEVRSAFIIAAVKDRIAEKKWREYGYPLDALNLLFRCRFNVDIAADLDALIQKGEILVVSRAKCGQNVSDVVVSLSVAEAQELHSKPRKPELNPPKVYLSTNLPKNWKDDRFTMRERLNRI